MYRSALAAFTLALMLAATACSSRQLEIIRVADGVTIALALEPAVAGEANQISVRLERRDRPLDGAEVHAILDMREMQMGGHPLRLRPEGAGRYVASGITFSMRGDWRVRVEFATPGDSPHAATFLVTVR